MYRIKAFFKLGSPERCRNEVLRSLGGMDLSERADMIRALVPAVISFQIPVKLGVKLVAQTAALFWSLDHVFCNFEAGNALSQFQLSNSRAGIDIILALFILHWLVAVESVGLESITDEETKVYKLLSDLLIEANPEQLSDPRPLSQRFLTVKAYQYKGGVQVWGGKTPSSGRLIFSDDAIEQTL